ncbi:MAG: hypothetical protein CL927_09945 [Deltaproteobacteria bacterium]|nr:hypothetical protein [Deltaproteobacteria bacterium]HCH62080.1 hypothetical protein [Deltaproteobacteria bacterium]
MRCAFLLPLLGLACSASFDPKDGGGTGTTQNFPGAGSSGSNGGSGNGGTAGDDDGGTTDGSADSGGDVAGSIDDLDNLKVDMVTTAEGCQDRDGLTLAGAASYFYGELEPEGGSDTGPQWVGSEEWLLYANDSWREAGVDDCRVTWVLRGEEAETGSCTACDLTLALVGALDETRTTCPEDLWNESRSFSVKYDIQLDSGTNQSQWFFADSGTTLGTGSYSGLALNYLSSRTCVWF